MDPGLKTPLIESFLRGDVDRDSRLLAARGGIAARALEQLALLVMLAHDAEPEVSSAATATLAGLPTEKVAGIIARRDVPSALLEFFASRSIQPAESPIDDDTPLVAGEGPDIADDSDTEQTALQRLQAMNVPQRMARASKGTREERAILIRDPNKIIAMTVLSSPKLTESEVEAIAKMANVTEEVLRTIAHNRNWMKSYAVASALVRNPKTPLAVSMNLLARLNDKDLRTLSTNRNIPEVLRTTARKKVVIDK